MASVSKRTVDFSNVKDAGNFNTKRIPDGDYRATITKVEDAEAKDGVFQYLFTIKLDKYSQLAYPYYCKLQENQLWKLRNLLIAAGINVPKKRIQVDPARLIGKAIGVTMEDDEYDGKEKSVIAAVFPSADLMDGNLVEDEDEEPEEDEEVESDDVEDDVEDNEPEADPFEDMDRTQLKAYIKERQESFQAKKSQTDDDLRELARSLGGVAEEPEDDEEDEEPEEKPTAKVTRKAAAAPAKKTAARRKATEVTDEELEELNIDDL